MIIEYHVIFIENLAENSDENFVVFCFDLVVQNCHNNINQNFYCVAKSYSSLF